MLEVKFQQYRVDSGRGLNRTLSPLSALCSPVFAGEQDVRPPKGLDVGQELGLDRQAGVSSLSDRFAQMGGSPVNDDGAALFSVSRPTVYRTLNRYYFP